MADKRFDPEDPMNFVGVGMECSPEEFDRMVETIIEEYMLMGWTEARIRDMFRMPFYQLTHAIYLQKGEPYVQARIDRVRNAWSPQI
jgi:hypothetical protein